jgi:hypothetical protein
VTVKFAAWVAVATGGASARQIGLRVGKSHTTVLRWLNDGTPPRAAILIAIAYRADPFAALIAADVIDEGEIPALASLTPLNRVPQVRLTAELHRRALQSVGMPTRAT